MIVRFYKQDKEYEIYCLENTGGYVLNLLSSKKPKDKKMHRINGCSSIAINNISGMKTSVPKYCSISLVELEEFANNKVGKNKWEKCDLCF